MRLSNFSTNFKFVSIGIWFLHSQLFTGGHFYFLFTVESATSKLLLQLQGQSFHSTIPSLLNRNFQSKEILSRFKKQSSMQGSFKENQRNIPLLNY